MDLKFKNDKTTYRNLLTIKGIGHSHAKIICNQLGIGLDTKYGKLSQTRTEELNRLLARKRKEVSINPIEHNLYLFNLNAIKRLVTINCYRGRRLKMGYPARGQRTRSNANTAKKLKRHYS